MIQLVTGYIKKRDHGAGQQFKMRKRSLGKKGENRCVGGTFRN